MKRPADAYSYAYLLGMYLGDGHVADTRRSFQLRITLDGLYPDIITECAGAMILSLPSTHPRIRCRQPRKRRGVCSVRLARGEARFVGMVRVWYRQEGAATRWYYSVDVVRRLTGCQGGGCRRDLRRPNRLGGAVHR